MEPHITFYSGIGYGEGDPRYIAYRLKRIPQNEVIRVSIDSPGGSAQAALTIFEMLRQDPREVHVHVMGQASSAASIVMLAGDRITASPSSTFVLHKSAQDFFWQRGTADVHRDVAEQLDTIDGIMGDIYKSRGITDEQLSKLLNGKKDNMLDARTALSYGLIDKITTEPNKPTQRAIENQEARLPEMLAEARVEAKAIGEPATDKAPRPSTGQSTPPTSPTSNIKEEMTPDILKALNLNEGASPEAVQASIEAQAKAGETRGAAAALKAVATTHNLVPAPSQKAFQALLEAGNLEAAQSLMQPPATAGTAGNAAEAGETPDAEGKAKRKAPANPESAAAKSDLGQVDLAALLKQIPGAKGDGEDEDDARAKAFNEALPGIDDYYQKVRGKKK